MSCKNEIARTLFKLGSIHQDLGDLAEGRRCMDEAEDLRREILGNVWTPATSAADFELLVRFWSR